MTVTSSVSRADYATDGATKQFQIPFYFLDATHIGVTVTTAAGVIHDLVLGSDFTVSGVGNEHGGDIQTVDTWGTGGKLAIYRTVPATQESSYQQNDPFPAKTTEKALDKLTMLAQQAVSSIARALTLGLRDVDGSGAYLANNNRISNLGTPIADTDAATVGAARDIAEQLTAGVVGGYGSFFQSGPNAVERTFQSKMRDEFDVRDFGAKLDGASDDAAAFVSAIAAVPDGATLRVPSGIVYLSENPAAGSTKSIKWDFALGVQFIGPGATGLGSFGRLASNPWVVASGPYELFRDVVPTPTGGASIQRAIEIIGPPSGAHEQCALYVGGNSNRNIEANNVQCLVNLVQNVDLADKRPFVWGAGANILKSLEIDVNVDVSEAGAPSAPGILGILLTGGGAGGPYQGNATYGILFQRSTCLWETAIDVSAAIVGMAVTASDTALFIRTEYSATPGATIPSGTTGRGIYFDNAPYLAGPLFVGRQLKDGTDAIWIARKTDSNPQGTYLRLRDAANQNDLFMVNIDGSFKSYAPANANGSSINAGSAELNGLTLRGGTNLRLGVDWIAGDTSTTGYVVIYDSHNRPVAVPGRLL
ncbi:phage tail fiber domain-containing protein [Burkholderia multivorans]|uniref:phage tail fiber domain-containing protein n=1 Tax=Burkholderia multivorans TaxID=87883 RepID=UPI001C12B1C9|nr:phage tail fiber protein [Burkholderia multivorans]MBU9120042.1 hypothetical protein [Burkholderia multivorans]